MDDINQFKPDYEALSTDGGMFGCPSFRTVAANLRRNFKDGSVADFFERVGTIIVVPTECQSESFNELMDIGITLYEYVKIRLLL